MEYSPSVCLFVRLFICQELFSETSLRNFLNFYMKFGCHSIQNVTARYFRKNLVLGFLEQVSKIGLKWGFASLLKSRQVIFEKIFAWSYTNRVSSKWHKWLFWEKYCIVFGPKGAKRAPKWGFSSVAENWPFFCLKLQ